MAGDRITKVEAHYHKAALVMRRCGNCSMFLKDGRCTLVEGKIDPDYVCKYWKMKVKDA